MLFRQFKSISQAFYALFADSGFAMAGAVAYSFVLSFFPFCIFLGALAGYFGGEALAKQAIAQLFELVPAPVAQAIAPEVMAVMGRSRFGLLTVGALISLFFAMQATFTYGSGGTNCAVVSAGSSSRSRPSRRVPACASVRIRQRFA